MRAILIAGALLIVACGGSDIDAVDEPQPTATSSSVVAASPQATAQPAVTSTPTLTSIPTAVPTLDPATVVTATPTDPNAPLLIGEDLRSVDDIADGVREDIVIDGWQRTCGDFLALNADELRDAADRMVEFGVVADSAVGLRFLQIGVDVCEAEQP